MADGRDDSQACLLLRVYIYFMCGHRQVSGGGIVRNPRVHRQVIADVTAGVEAASFSAHGCIESPIKGATSGNTEFLAYFRRQSSPALSFDEEP